MNDKDLILKTMISNPDPYSYFTPTSLIEEIFPKYNFDKVKHLLDSIKKEKPELIKKHDFIYEVGLAYQPTGLISEFLNQGGFTKIEKELSEFNKFNLEKEKIELRKTKVDLELAEKMLKEYPKTKLISRISIIIGIVLMLKELYILTTK
ncbi:hypothetical protein [Polaribacter staleyi]|uniref:hypothetical protein n=1 Tax=Polaribacter staleyi TaxID=2022337 RepID=UPI0031BAC8D3